MGNKDLHLYFICKDSDYKGVCQVGKMLVAGGWLLPTAYSLLPTAYCQPSTVNRQPSTASLLFPA